MKRSAPTRSRALASKLRAEANDARGAFEAWERDGRDLEDPEWERLGKVYEASEAKAQRAEAAEKEKPLAGKRAAQGRVRKARAEASSGSRVVASVDGADLARVAQCSGRDCGAAVELRGDPWRLWALGWGSTRDASRLVQGTWPRAWWCPECWVPPQLTAEDADAPCAVALGGHGAPDQGRGVLVHLGPMLSRAAVEASRGRSDSRARRHLESDLRRLYEVDPARAEVVVQRLVATAPTTYLENAWRVFAEKLIGPREATQGQEEERDHGRRTG